MKIGMNLLLWTTHVTDEHYPQIAKIKAAGYDGVEVPLFEGDAAHFKTLRAELDRQGLECTTVAVATEEANPISPDAALRQAAVDELKRKIEYSAILGSSVLCGPFYQPLGVFTGDGPTDDEKKYVADVHREVADAAQAAGLKLGVEYLNRFECYFLNTAADAAAHVKRVGHPAFGMMYDTFHANIEERDPVGALVADLDAVRHVHLAENHRGTPGKLWRTK